MLYASYGSYLLVLFKFLLAFLVFEEINRLLPYVGRARSDFLWCYLLH